MAWTEGIELSPNARHALAEIRTELGICILSLIGPASILYFAMYTLAKHRIKDFEKLSWLSITAFLLSSWLVAIECNTVRSVQLFAVAIGSMKALDLYARRHSPPQYAYKERPSDALLAVYYLTELRYESFIPSHVQMAPGPQSNDITKPQTKIHHKRNQILKLEFSEPVNLVLHATFFGILQAFFPQSNPAVLALQILLAIYVIWESLELVLRYRTSPPLFGPVYKASSLSSFWGETWHSAFASPCRSLAYGPIRHSLPRYGVPVQFARGMGIIASFALMGFFHIYALEPLLPVDALARICAFFLLNGVGTVIEDAVWGKRAHWGKALLAWVFEIIVASWTVEGLSVPNGLRNIEWSSICDVGKESSTLL